MSTTLPPAIVPVVSEEDLVLSMICVVVVVDLSWLLVPVVAVALNDDGTDCCELRGGRALLASIVELAPEVGTIVEEVGNEGWGEEEPVMVV